MKTVRQLCIQARIDEYEFVRQFVEGIEKQGWYLRRIESLKRMLEHKR